MKRVILLIFFIPLLLQGVTGSDIYDRFILDGISDEFTEDEYVLRDSAGVSLESETDSYWGEYNDLRQIKVTWDDTNLYIAVDACAWDNNVILYLDIYDDYGLEDQTELNTWKRNFKFYNFNPDFFLATWDTNTDPQFWMIREGQSKNADEINSEDFAGFNTGQLGRSMEAVISFEDLYYSEWRSMRNFPSIKVIALIVAGDDNTSGPDCAPDNLGGMAQDAGENVIIDNYAEILIDSNGDGYPDTDNIKPWERVTYLETPPVKGTALDITRIVFPDGKGFNRKKEEYISIRFYTNRLTPYFVDIFNMEGKKVGSAVEISSNDTEKYYDYQWYGLDQSGNPVPYGIYIARVFSDSGEITRNEAFAVLR